MKTNVWIDEAGAERQQLIKKTRVESWFWPLVILAAITGISFTLSLVRLLELSNR